MNFATVELVRSTPIKQRLICAYRRHLAVVPQDQLPGEAREAFRQLWGMLHSVEPMRGEDAVAASVRKMSLQEADDCAGLVVEIFALLSRQRQSGGRSPAPVVQLHNPGSDPSEPVADEFAAALLSRA